jgi:hypothetical protein
LFSIVGDPAKWAYLMLVPHKWTEKTCMQYAKIFTKHGLGVEVASFREDPRKFWALCNTLFLTKEERRV